MLTQNSFYGVFTGICDQQASVHICTSEWIQKKVKELSLESHEELPSQLGADSESQSQVHC